MVYNKKGYDYPKSIGKRDTVSLGLDRQEFSYTKISLMSQWPTKFLALVTFKNPQNENDKFFVYEKILAEYFSNVFILFIKRYKFRIEFTQ